ncbi:hypothetical protein KBY65_12495 [Cyanobium sp. Alchichica 3B3-8F6]|uniref:hypothetical protein n=1 Tax=Cyanobium sp. ATX 6E8 TaxID=2823701 RepID=UPI0020CF570E|nr:hypothetical protein [Cyanobium sp. ATX 6E8]MCP9883281.1 hypothetical protein [Cyanobium sp. Alchichica 3B3-8F6]MCP9943123.1 hypothetical protein [Cyanobium sp. ATX 6E8]
MTITAIRAKEPARAINKAMVMADASTTATIIAAEGSKPSLCSQWRSARGAEKASLYRIADIQRLCRNS